MICNFSLRRAAMATANRLLKQTGLWDTAMADAVQVSPPAVVAWSLETEVAAEKQQELDRIQRNLARQSCREMPRSRVRGNFREMEYNDFVCVHDGLVDFP